MLENRCWGYSDDKKGENLLHELFEKQVTSTAQSLRTISTEQTACVSRPSVLYVSVSIFFFLIARMHIIAWSDRVKDTQMRDRGGEWDIKHECADIAEAFGRDGMLVKFVDRTSELKIALSLFLCPLCIDGWGEGDGVIPHFADE